MTLKIKKLSTVLFLIISTILISSCQDKDQLDPETTKSDKYCIMFYAAGGDLQHDLIEMTSLNEAAKETLGSDKVVMTTLFQGSGDATGFPHTGAYRYTAQDGKLVIDSDFKPAQDFLITNPDNLTDFLKWSALKYPNHNYIFVFMGHGIDWYIDVDLPINASPKGGTKASISNNHKLIGSYDMAQSIIKSGIKLDAMIAHSCLQGSVEMFADWQDLAHYYLGSSLSIPDYGYDYRVLINQLQQNTPLEKSLRLMGERAMDIWSKTPETTSITLTDFSKINKLWEPLKETFTHMEKSLLEKCTITDPPAITNDYYWQGYQRAVEAVSTESGIPGKPVFAIDLMNYLRNAVAMSGDMFLVNYINKINNVLDEVILMHLQSNDQNTQLYGIASPANVTIKPAYATSKFDKLTNWYKFSSELYKHQ